MIIMRSTALDDSGDPTNNVTVLPNTARRRAHSTVLLASC
jgi:hypothetical protein